MMCPDCGAAMVGCEYAYGDPERYDGVSEFRCFGCGTRIGRWTGARLAEGEAEPRMGRGTYAWRKAHGLEA